MRGLVLISVLLAAVLPGCERCSARSDGPEAPDAAPLPVVSVALLPPPRPFTFVRQTADLGLALPERCRFRAFTARAAVAASTRFVAEPHMPATLVIADATGDPPRLTGVGALPLDAGGPTGAPVGLPWTEATALPRLAMGGGTWVAGIDRAGSRGAGQVILWRGGTAELLGEGDGFASADLACGESTCALLTTRRARVEAPGATVWIGAPGEPAGRWRPVEIVPAAADSDARPVGIAAMEAQAADAGAGAVGVTAALVEKGEVVFYRADAAGVREEARVPASQGVLDVIALPAPVAMTLSAAADEEGCPRDGRPGLRFARVGQPPAEIPTPAPATHGALRRLSRGALALWIAPLGCRHARRVVYGVVLDEQGAPAGAPLPIGDATAFTAAARGDDVDLYLEEPGALTWVRMTCTAP